MPKISLKEVENLKNQGYEIKHESGKPIRIDREKKRIERKERVPKLTPDPIPALIKNMTAELKQVSLDVKSKQATVISNIISGFNDLTESLKKKERPKTNKFIFKTYDKDGNLKYTTEVTRK